MPASKTATLKGLLERRPSLNPRKNVKTLKDSADSGSSFGPSGRLSGPCRLGLMGEALDLEVLYRSKTPKTRSVVFKFPGEIRSLCCSSIRALKRSRL